MGVVPVKNEKSGQPVPHRKHIGQLIFVIVAVTATILLAYWQFSRWNTTSSFQNLGYALQWPAFGIFFIWAYRRYIQFENEKLEGNDQAAHHVDEGVMTEIPEDFLPTNPDGTRKEHKK